MRDKIHNKYVMQERTGPITVGVCEHLPLFAWLRALFLYE